MSTSELIAFPPPCESLRQTGAGLHPHGVYNPYACNRVGGEYTISVKGALGVASKVGEKRAREEGVEVVGEDPAQSILARWKAGGNCGRYAYTAPHDTYRFPALPLTEGSEALKGGDVKSEVKLEGASYDDCDDEDEDADRALERAMKHYAHIQGLTPSRIDPK